MPSPCRPPAYGSPEWLALDKDDPQRKEAVLFAADCWRLLMASPHVSALLGEWVESMHRRTMREASWAISAAVDWRTVASHPTYAELEERRGELSRIYRCDWKMCGEDGVPHRCPHTRGQIILCPRHSHLGIPEERGVVPEVNVAGERLAARARRRAELASTAETPEQIRVRAAASWAVVESRIADQGRAAA